jgi:hypothetical protein
MAEPLVLVVGSCASWRTRQGRPESLPGFLFCDYGDLALVMGGRPVVDIVLSPLMARGFDALDVAIQLAGMGFVGRYRAVVDDLPDRSLVCREVRHAAPQLDFDVVLAADVISLRAPRQQPH